MNRIYIKICLILCIVTSSEVKAQDVKLKQITNERLESVRDTLSIKLGNYNIPADSILNDSIPVWPYFMTARLDSTVHNSPYAKGISIGVMVYDHTADSVLYAFNEKRLFKPASTEKLLTSITALKELGGDHNFTSRIYYQGEIKTDTIFFLPDSVRVNLPIEEQVDSLGNPLYRLTQVLHGDIYGVGSYDPMLSGTELNIFADSIQALRIDSICGNIYEDVSHRYNGLLTPFLVNKASSFMPAFRDALKRRNISLSGQIGIASCPTDAILVAERTHQLKHILNRTMKQSDNQYAEAIFHRLGSFSKEVHSIKKMIQLLGYNYEDYIIFDGSGLSHDNRVSPELEIAFLKYAKEQDSIYSILYETLPIAGVDGTLSSRMGDNSAHRNVHAKTGTLNGVITLAGYCKSFNQHDLIFSIMLNDIKSSVTAKALEDELCTIMTHDSTFIPKKKVIIPRTKVRRRTPARKRKKK